MGIVNLKILNSIHQVACNDGEEDKLYAVASKLDHRLMKTSLGTKATEIKLLVLTALMMEDELEDLRDKVNMSANNHSSKDEDTDIAVIKTLDAVTEYVENLANKLEKL
jgi:cell division protein ZapA